jgi:hypothetical protein
MTLRLITADVWDAISEAARRSKNPAHVAVAYFGKHAARLLPLSAGSRLVVDASEAAVKSGQTHPADLERIRRRKVTVYSAQNLHAKVFAFDKAIFIGSANASKHSATALQEAVVFTTDAAIGRAVRSFVKSLCLEPLGPAELKRLQKLYRPPRFVPGGSGKAGAEQRSALSSLRLAQLTEAIRSPKSLDAALETGAKEAERRRQEGEDHYVEGFYWWGRSSWRTGQLVIEVFKERSGRRTVSPPGHVIHLRRWRSGKRRATCVFVELPDRDWVSFSSLKRRFGQGAERYLKRGGFVRDQTFAKRLLSFWQEGVT